jgi:hypothetical protein
VTDLVCSCVLQSLPDMHCPVHGDLTSLGPIDPELEAALEATQGEVVSAPPPDAKPSPCRSHGSPFAGVMMTSSGTNYKSFEDGCKERL